MSDDASDSIVGSWRTKSSSSGKKLQPGNYVLWKRRFQRNVSSKEEWPELSNGKVEIPDGMDSPEYKKIYLLRAQVLRKLVSSLDAELYPIVINHLGDCNKP